MGIGALRSCEALKLKELEEAEQVIEELGADFERQKASSAKAMEDADVGARAVAELNEKHAGELFGSRCASDGKRLTNDVSGRNLGRVHRLLEMAGHRAANKNSSPYAVSLQW